MIPRADDRAGSTPVRGLLALAAAIAVVLALPVLARADYRIVVCGAYANQVFHPSSSYGMLTYDSCPAPSGTTNGVLGLDTNFTQTFSQGQGAIWQAVAPQGLEITGAAIPTGNILMSGVNDGSGYRGNFYWQGGSWNISANGASFGPAAMNSRYFGFLLACARTTCSKTNANISVSNIHLAIDETQPPMLSASGLWQASGWVRGRWPFAASSDSPSGVCALAASLNGLTLGETTSGTDPTVWHQCGAGSISTSVDTGRYGQGAVPLALSAGDAAGVPAATSETVYIDNQQPTVTLNGATDAPSTAGTQYVTATASAGPSGVAGISCSLDGAPPQWLAGSTAQIPVAGIGQHLVQCFSENNAVDPNGSHGASATESFTMKIGEPTVAVVAFSKVVNKLRCRRTTERVRIPARWVKVRVRGRIERVREKAHTQKIKVTRCHARTVRRRITREVTIRRHGKKVRVQRSRVVRVVVEPRTVFQTSRRVRHGRGTSVSGWLGTATGTALAGQTVNVLTAADNGRENFHVAALTTTAADGGWSARLPAGPSRLVEAGYPGAASTEGAISAPAHLIVPAKVQLLSVSPRRVPWGGTVHLIGQLKGGYLPRGGALVRLRIGLGNSNDTYGVREHVTGNGRFSTNYTFGAGDPGARRSFWFQIASLPMGDYPYAPASSRRLTVRVGGHPRRCCRSR